MREATKTTSMMKRRRRRRRWWGRRRRRTPRMAEMVQVLGGRGLSDSGVAFPEQLYDRSQVK